MEINKIEYEIGVYDLEGHFIDSSDDWEYLEKQFNLFKTNIRIGLLKNSSIISNYQLVLKNKNIESSVLPLCVGNVTTLITGGNKQKAVAKYYNDKLICVYNSISEASSLTFIPQGSISQSCISGWKSNAFQFKYIE